MGNLIDKVAAFHDVVEYKEHHWTGTFDDYLELVKENPRVTRNAFQRIYDMIMSYGKEEYVDAKKKLVHYKFFDDADNFGEDAVYGLDIPLMRLVNVFKSAALRYGTEKRVILLHGPVGSSKSTIARLLKKGLESYSKKPEGALYTYEWIDLPFGEDPVMPSPINEEPLHLIPQAFRAEALSGVGIDPTTVTLTGELNPSCRFVMRKLMEHYNGDLSKVLSHVRVKRLILSEKDRIGIGTFQPKDEKNQDSTELTGDINYRKIAIYGSESDPRAFNFDGEFQVANRGIVEFIEMLKLDVAFLYDLLGASQEHKIKPKKFPQTDIDEVIIGHTNEAEYNKLINNEFMEALRDRTVKIDIPYITKLSEEMKIYTKSFSSDRVRQVHIAPHTLEVAAMWAVATRLSPPTNRQLSLIQKLKLYNGKMLPGYTEDSVIELRKEAVGQDEGLRGISPRYIQDKISNALVSDKQQGSINPFLVLNELESGMRNHSLVNEAQASEFKELIGLVKQEYEDIVKSEVQRAISADEEALSRLCGNYIDNVKAYTQKERVKNKYTGQFEDPDERLMRSIENKIDIPDSRKDDFRREIMNYIGALAVEGKKFDYRTNERLHRALELKLFEDQKDSIKLSTIVSNVVDKETQEKIDIVKERMIRNYGYDEVSATDVLNFVASIFARGDAKES
ncbi:MAG: serine protein kinase [Myxococcota bacterium]|nr:serine protein kinase [Myxococcota bacterium]